MQYIHYIGLVRKVLNVARLSPDECLFIDQPDECGRRTSEGRAWSSIRCILEEFRSLSGNANVPRPRGCEGLWVEEACAVAKALVLHSVRSGSDTSTTLQPKATTK